MKPILFNTEMTNAVREERKTATRRVADINPDIPCTHRDHEFVWDNFTGGKATGFVCRKCGFGVLPPHSRHPCGPIQNATFTEDSECAAFNRAVEEKPMTNGDSIRAMSDDELEQFINHFNICDIRTSEECKISYCACCDVCVMDWLQQPAKED